MKQYAIIGASAFGKQILEELISLNCEIILIDKDPELIDYYKNDVTAAYITNVINQESLSHLIPADIDAVVVDLGDKIEASILVTQYLSKRGVAKIIVKAETDQHGEILSLIGANHVIFPNLEAAKRVSPLLVSELLFNYLPIAGGLVLAETALPKNLIDKNLHEVDLRRKSGINILAFRRKEEEAYQVPTLDHLFHSDDILLIVGREEQVLIFSGKQKPEPHQGLAKLFQQFFGRGH